MAITFSWDYGVGQEQIAVECTCLHLSNLRVTVDPRTGVLKVGPGVGSPPVWYPLALAGDTLLVAGSDGVPHVCSALLWGQGTAAREIWSTGAVYTLLGGEGGGDSSQIVMGCSLQINPFSTWTVTDHGDGLIEARV